VNELFRDRPFALQLIGGIVIPVVFGLLTGLAMGWNEIAYWVLAGPLAILGGLLGGAEHDGADEGVVRGAIGGLIFGSFILLGHEIANNEPKVHLPEPQSGLVFATTLIGAVLGGVGGYWRAKRLAPARSPGPAGSSASRR
jgi:hypothetical protein